MDMVRQFDDDRFYRRATRLLAAAVILAVVGFAVYYYVDRYSGRGATMVDQEISRVEKMVKNDPSNPTNRISLAELYVHKGNYSDAITQYGEALKLDDKNLSALAGQGLSFFKSGKMKESQANFERIIDLSKGTPAMQRTPAMGSVHFYLGQIYASQGDLAKAEDELRQALSINKADADTMVQLADVVAKEGRANDAIDLYKTAIDVVPNYREAYTGLAAAYTAAGMKAESDYATAMIDYCDGKLDSAIGRLQSVVQAKPDLAVGYFGLGASLDKKGQKDQALAAYQKALDLDPSNEAARVSLVRLGGTPPANSAAPSGH